MAYADSFSLYSCDYFWKHRSPACILNGGLIHISLSFLTKIHEDYLPFAACLWDQAAVCRCVRDAESGCSAHVGSE